jgi:hypothetical protein
MNAAKMAAMLFTTRFRIEERLQLWEVPVAMVVMATPIFLAFNF